MGEQLPDALPTAFGKQELPNLAYMIHEGWIDHPAIESLKSDHTTICIGDDQSLTRRESFKVTRLLPRPPRTSHYREFSLGDNLFPDRRDPAASAAIRLRI
jgi:hypothetical protein